MKCSREGGEAVILERDITLSEGNREDKVTSQVVRKEGTLRIVRNRDTDG